MKKAVLFDLGGTLLVPRRDQIFHRVLDGAGWKSTLENVHASYVRVEPRWLAEFGNRELSPDETNRAYRVKDTMAFTSLFPDAPAAETERVTALARELWPRLDKEIPYELFPDAKPLLRRVTSEGLSAALVSNAPADTRKVVDALGLGRYLKSVIISGSVGYSKPHPEIFRMALREIGAEPQEAVHVGDVYEADVVGARSAGIEGLLIDRDGSRSDLDCPRIRSLHEVYRFLV